MSTFPTCSYCDATEGLRQHHDGGVYIAPDYVCEECFTGTDTGPCFDDLPLAPMSESEIAHLRMFRPETYSIFLGDVGKRLEARGYVTWVPPMFGGISYAITAAGKDALANLDMRTPVRGADLSPAVEAV